MSPFDISKVIRAFSYNTLGTFLTTAKNWEGITIISPVKVFISIKFAEPEGLAPRPDPLTRVKLYSYIRDVIDNLVDERFIGNAEQVYEVGIEKTRGEENEVMVFLQQV